MAPKVFVEESEQIVVFRLCYIISIKIVWCSFDSPDELPKVIFFMRVGADDYYHD